MPKKKSGRLRTSLLKDITIVDLIGAFNSLRTKSEQFPIDPAMDPAHKTTPYKVESVDADKPGVIAHIRSYYQHPPRVEGKLVLEIPECVRSKKAKRGKQ